MATYKTPNVYVEEISVFPPSVAEVETAIPAFIGYTEKATKLATDDLRNKPTLVKSRLDFETYFGYGAPINLSAVNLGDDNGFLSATFTNPYYLYDSLRQFFDNGGGKCYIVSVGDYSDTPDREVLKGGVDALKKVDEPTMLLFPDAVNLNPTDLGAVQVHALAQCANLGDRVGVFDTRFDDPNGAAFRDNIGINNLKYGAAYSPWLQVNYGKNVSYQVIKNVVPLATLTSEAGIQTIIQNLDDALDDVDTVTTAISTFLGTSASIGARFDALMTTYKNDKTLANIQAVFTFLYQLATLVDDWLDATSGVSNSALEQDIRNAITSPMVPAFSELIANEKELDAAVSGTYTPQWDVDPDPSEPEWGNIFTTSSPAASTVIPGTATTDVARMDALLPNIARNFTTVRGAISGIVEGAAQYVVTYEQSLYDSYPVYQTIVRGINNTATQIPPSGAIAGIYAFVDNQRGVWKAPANVSLTNVIGPTYQFDLSETDDLNVDTNAGKSINAIRAITGKGTLVMGARTLAGNDNEWRYISVRRFFNMVEESVKKSTFWAIFEPNDANTWVKVRGMIENYLTQKWREGALAGATPEDAFFVKCGLGTTMTPQDILEGRMNVEIGMAVVRPAEFIILKFSHKLQTS
jgi:phage tail sheath protein FI